MLKALPSEASDSTRPCSTSPRGLCSFNDRRKGSPRQRGGGASAAALGSLLPGTRLSGSPLPSFFSRVNPASTLALHLQTVLEQGGAAWLQGGC